MYTTSLKDIKNARIVVVSVVGNWLPGGQEWGGRILTVNHQTSFDLVLYAYISSSKEKKQNQYMLECI